MSGDLESIPRDVQVGGADRVRVERRVRRLGRLQIIWKAGRCLPLSFWKILGCVSAMPGPIEVRVDMAKINTEIALAVFGIITHFFDQHGQMLLGIFEIVHD